MKRKVVFVCSYCGSEFKTEGECRAHELSELSISQADYEEFCKLRTALKITESNLRLYDEEKTRKAYEAAKKAMSEFEARTMPFDKWKEI